MKACSSPVAGSDVIASVQTLPEAVVDAAITWAVKLDYGEPSRETKKRFQHWLEADPLHQLAWSRIGVFKKLPDPVLSTLGREALAAADQKHRQRRRNLKVLSLAGLGLLMGYQARNQLGWQTLLADAATAVGQQRTLRLDDGSVIVLNTATAISTNLTAERRLVILRQGEIMITTGPDSAMPHKRPFWVLTPFGKMQALGTRFVVRLERDRARISVQEGAVELHPAGAGMSAVAYPGQSWWLADEGVQLAAPRKFSEDGFAEGVIAGENIRLADLLQELERYRRGTIFCDPAVADLRISGVFHIENTDAILQFLVQTQALNVTYRTRFWVSVGPRQSV